MSNDLSTYDPSYFPTLFDIEDRHFWFVGRNAIIARLLRDLASKKDAPRFVIELGCGTGNVLRFVKRACAQATVVGMDLFFEGLRFARARSGAALVQGDVRQNPFRRPADLVCLFDVLEHIPDDVAALASIRELVADGGRLLLTVPLHPSLWSEFDELSHHQRRYTVTELKRKVEAAGFTIEYATPYIVATLPPMWIYRRFFSRAGGDRKRAEDELKIVPVANGVLKTLLRIEAALIARRVRLPFGSSMILLARKR
jgi:SAM-dependent methyltransferase